MREDVRQGPPPSPPSGSAPDIKCQTDGDGSDGFNLFALPAALWGVGVVATSPIWVPQGWLQDNFTNPGYFHRFPYDGASGYLTTIDSSPDTKPWAVRMDVEYLDTFDRLDNLGGHLLVDTATRLGVTASWDHLEERVSDRARDALQIGDANLVYRFAQSESAEFRTGLGLNWMNDASRTDVGFNFTYAVDIYPRNPWVLSSAIDAGMLGKAGLFRFHTTAGIMLHGLEPYVGYEYTDIGRAHWNGLIAGLRYWF
jgi:hypothetical protein